MAIMMSNIMMIGRRTTKTYHRYHKSIPVMDKTLSKRIPTISSGCRSRRNCHNGFQSHHLGDSPTEVIARRRRCILAMRSVSNFYSARLGSAESSGSIPVRPDNLEGIPCSSGDFVDGILDCRSSYIAHPMPLPMPMECHLDEFLHGMEDNNCPGMQSRLGNEYFVNDDDNCNINSIGDYHPTRSVSASYSSYSRIGSSQNGSKTRFGGGVVVSGGGGGSGTGAGGGGGNNGRYRCPKCGSYVSFRHDNFEENTFYCATCSGWFLVTPNTTNGTFGDGEVGNGVSNRNDLQNSPDVPSSDLTEKQLLAMNFNSSQIKDRLDRGKRNNSDTTFNRRRQRRTSSPSAAPGDDSDLVMLTKKSTPDDNDDGRISISTTTSSTSTHTSTHRRGSSSNQSTTTNRGKWSTKKRTIFTPIEICRGLDEYVIGQQNVKIALSVGVYNHYKRIELAESNAAARAAIARRNADASDSPGSGEGVDRMMEGAEIVDSPISVSSSLHRGSLGFIDDTPLSPDHSKFQSAKGGVIGNTSSSSSTGDMSEGRAYCEASINSITSDENSVDGEYCELDKSNIIIIGPTGSGKTLLVRTLARLIDVPIVIADATCLTQAGYVGEDVESILLKLFHESGQDLERCQRGIVYIDEADKIRKSGGNISISRDVSGEGVQHALLKIVEGNVINVPKEPGRKNPRGDFLSIDTTNILFICGGAFSGLERIINRRMDAASIGFGAQMRKELDDHGVQGRYFDNAIPKDLVEYGMIPEFVGRFPVIESTRGLDVRNLIEILTVPKNSLIKQYKLLFGKDGVSFHVTDCALEEIAKVAHTRGSGARGLRSITENILMETMFVVPSISKCHTVYVDAEAVRGERKPVLLKEKNMTVEKYEALKRAGEHEDADGAEAVYIGDPTDRDVDAFGQAA